MERLEVDELRIRLVGRCLPGQQFAVGRALRLRVAVAFGHAGITLPPSLHTVPVAP